MSAIIDEPGLAGQGPSCGGMRCTGVSEMGWRLGIGGWRGVAGVPAVGGAQGEPGDST